MRDMTPRFFRIIIVAYSILSAALLLLAIYMTGYAPALEEAYANQIASHSTLELFGLAASGVIVLVLCVVNTVGLFFFKKWSRTLGIYLTVFGILAAPFFGPILESGLEGAVSESSSVIWGAIIALAYYSPAVRERFES